jgi:predicted phage terminase large subunit-like protein
MTTGAYNSWVNSRRLSQFLGGLSLSSPQTTEEPQAAEVAELPVLSFRQFVDLVKPRYVWYHHTEALAAVLQRVADDELFRVMVFEPPRHGKSEEVSRLFSAYYLYRHPERFVGITSYAAELAYTLSRAARDNYQRAEGVLRDDAAAVKHWETDQGGGLWAAGVGGPITGKGFHLGIIDDPIKNAEEAASEKIRQSHQEWYDSTFYTRAEPGAAIIVIQTRWHEQDLSGWLLSQEHEEPEHWHIVSFEAIKEEEPRPFPPTCTVEPDWRQPGEPLCPERYTLERLLKIAKRIGQYFWGALYQQWPRPREGNFFKRAWFSQFVDAIPAGVKRVRYWDKAGAAEGKGDYTVGLLMAWDQEGYFYIEDVVRGQWTAHTRNKTIRATAELDKQTYGKVITFIEQPPGLAKESTDEVIRLLAGFSVYADRVSANKEERAEPFKAQCEAGNVRIKRAPWNKAYIDELCNFPTGANDDQVDGSSGGFNRLVQLKDAPAVAPQGTTQTSKWRMG